MKHTKGPWKIWESKKSEYIIRNDDSIGELVLVANPGPPYRQNDLEKFKQNVNLIVAAPELLTWTKELLHLLKLMAPEEYRGVRQHVLDLINRASPGEGVDD